MSILLAQLQSLQHQVDALAVAIRAVIASEQDLAPPGFGGPLDEVMARTFGAVPMPSETNSIRAILDRQYPGKVPRYVIAPRYVNQLHASGVITDDQLRSIMWTCEQMRFHPIQGDTGPQLRIARRPRVLPDGTHEMGDEIAKTVICTGPDPIERYSGEETGKEIAQDLPFFMQTWGPAIGLAVPAGE